MKDTKPLDVAAQEFWERCILAATDFAKQPPLLFVPRDHFDPKDWENVQPGSVVPMEDPAEVKTVEMSTLAIEWADKMLAAWRERFRPEPTD